MTYVNELHVSGPTSSRLGGLAVKRTALAVAPTVRRPQVTSNVLAPALSQFRLTACRPRDINVARGATGDVEFHRYGRDGGSCTRAGHGSPPGQRCGFALGVFSYSHAFVVDCRAY